jgi:hypothetical protein
MSLTVKVDSADTANLAKVAAPTPSWPSGKDGWGTKMRVLLGGQQPGFRTRHRKRSAGEGDEDDVLGSFKGALYKRKDFLDVEEEGTHVRCEQGLPMLLPR